MACLPDLEITHRQPTAKLSFLPSPFPPLPSSKKATVTPDGIFSASRLCLLAVFLRID